MSVLATRVNSKNFEVDVIGVETLSAVVEESWTFLSSLRERLNRQSVE